MDPKTTLAASAALPTPDGVSALAARSLARESGAAFQSLLAATHDALGRLIATVRAAESSALCLAQQEHAHGIAENLIATREALYTGIADEARCLRTGAPSLSAALRGLVRPTRQRLADAAQAVREAARTSLQPEACGGSGWFVSTARAVEALGETATHLDALAEAQPQGSAARELGAEVASMLRHSRDTLLADIERLVD
ncbi:hypothetical protein [Rubricoccus marinus]|uniref:Uncharacterized protein n=1 Tax=Rubricoccus marinus TaxID=716817 RepID=A0A259TVP6_9BACT|nr:hypothetical protein [Rubricoccus marinus]OZC01835.1 hypothetical protein BSZ36_01820 [Rubricoccus marinus]